MDVLEAAHITPRSELRPDYVASGLLLRAAPAAVAVLAAIGVGRRARLSGTVEAAVLDEAIGYLHPANNTTGFYIAAI